jgi:hypothetical protein
MSMSRTAATTTQQARRKQVKIDQNFEQNFTKRFGQILPKDLAKILPKDLTKILPKD